MRSHHQFCPLAQAADVLSERWTLLVLRELLAGSTRFVDLMRGLPRMSRSVLSTRLKTLLDAGLVDRLEDADGVQWVPTEAGAALWPVLEALGVWAQHHLRRDVSEDELDVSLLMWDIRRNVSAERLGPPPVVVKFHLHDAPEGQRTYWLVRRDEGVELCLSDPHAPSDASVWSDLRSLTEVWIGRRALREALTTGDVRVEGGAVARRFPDWFGLSPFAPAGLASFVGLPASGG